MDPETDLVVSTPSEPTLEFLEEPTPDAPSSEPRRYIEFVDHARASPSFERQLF